MLVMTAGLPPPYWVYAIRYFALCHNTQKRGEDETPWKARFGEEFDYPLIPFGSAVRYLPPPDTRIKQPKVGPRTRVGIYLGYVHHAGGSVGPDHYVMPLDQLNGLNMKTGMKADGKRPCVDRPEQLWTSTCLTHSGPPHVGMLTTLSPR